MIIQIILLQAIICYIIDCSGFIQSLEWWLGRFTGRKYRIPKPFSCSSCSGWWSGIAYLLITNNFTLPYIACVALFSFMSKNISGMLRLLQEILIFIENKIYQLMK